MGGGKEQLHARLVSSQESPQNCSEIKLTKQSSFIVLLVRETGPVIRIGVFAQALFAHFGAGDVFAPLQSGDSYLTLSLARSLCRRKAQVHLRFARKGGLAIVRSQPVLLTPPSL